MAYRYTKDSEGKMTVELAFRQLRTLSDLTGIEDLQEEIWGYGRSKGSPLPYPARCLFEFSESGGHIGGAFRPEGRLIGFSAAWIGRETKTHDLYLHSQLVGVTKEFRNIGVGFRLKMLQRKYALSEGIATIKWTFDPLQLRNAVLNIRKLRAEATRFVPNYFGLIGGSQNDGFPTDRLWVTWNLAKARLHNARINLSQLPHVLRITGALPSIEVDLSLCDHELALSVPGTIGELRSASPELFRIWQSKMRQAFMHYLPRYVISDIVLHNDQFSYILRRI